MKAKAPLIRVIIGLNEFRHLCARQAIGFHADGVDVRIRLGDGVTEPDMVSAIADAMKGPQYDPPEARELLTLSAYRKRRR